MCVLIMPVLMPLTSDKYFYDWYNYAGNNDHVKNVKNTTCVNDVVITLNTNIGI